MNIQNYILPVSIAATIHVAFLTYGVKEPPHEHIKIIEVPLPPLPPKPDDMVVQPEEKTEIDQPVLPLAGGPTPPTMDDPPVTPKLNDLTVPREEQHWEFTKNLRITPTNIGGIGPEVTGPQTQIRWLKPADLDHIPRATVQTAPNYPSSMQQNGITGSVTVEFDVDTQGRVTRAEVIKYTHREFADPAVRAVLQWHFEPGKRNGRAVPFRMAVPIEFNRSAD